MVQKVSMSLSTRCIQASREGLKKEATNTYWTSIPIGYLYLSSVYTLCCADVGIAAGFCFSIRFKNIAFSLFVYRLLLASVFNNTQLSSSHLLLMTFLTVLTLPTS